LEWLGQILFALFEIIYTGIFERRIKNSRAKTNSSKVDDEKA